MSREKLREGLGVFYNEVEERLKPLPGPERQQYLEGLVHAFDATTRYANPAELSPLEREQFFAAAKSWAYLRTHHLGLDPESRMKKLIETDGVNVAKAYNFAAGLQKAMGIPLDMEQQTALINVLMLAGFESVEG